MEYIELFLFQSRNQDSIAFHSPVSSVVFILDTSLLSLSTFQDVDSFSFLRVRAGYFVEFPQFGFVWLLPTISFSLPFASRGLRGFVCASIATIGLSDCPKCNRLVKVMSTRSFHYKGTIVPLSLMLGRTIIWDCGIFQQLPFCSNHLWSLPESVIINWWLQKDDFF